jgi:hypothetical protein
MIGIQYIPPICVRSLRLLMTDISCPSHPEKTSFTTAATLANNWNIGLDTAKKTLQVTTKQWGKKPTHPNRAVLSDQVGVHIWSLTVHGRTLLRAE